MSTSLHGAAEGQTFFRRRTRPCGAPVHSGVKVPADHPLYPHAAADAAPNFSRAPKPFHLPIISTSPVLIYGGRHRAPPRTHPRHASPHHFIHADGRHVHHGGPPHLRPPPPRHPRGHQLNSTYTLGAHVHPHTASRQPPWSVFQSVCGRVPQPARLPPKRRRRAPLFVIPSVIDVHSYGSEI